MDKSTRSSKISVSTDKKKLEHFLLCSDYLVHSNNGDSTSEIKVRKSNNVLGDGFTTIVLELGIILQFLAALLCSTAGELMAVLDLTIPTITLFYTYSHC